MPKVNSKNTKSANTAPKKSSKSTKTTASKKVSKPVVTEPVVVESVVNEPVVVEPVVNVVSDSVSVESVQESSVLDDIDTALSQVSAVRSQCTTICAVLRSIRTRHVREVKAAQKEGRKRNQKARKPSGFTKPSLITDRLAQFIKMVTKEDPGQLVARTQATKVITQYIRENNLQDKDNGRRIIPDAELMDLLSLNKGDELTYFNLQTKINHHFPKKAVVTEST